MPQKLRQNSSNECVETRTVNGVEVDIYGCWDRATPEGEYDFYDIYRDGEWLNVGEPFWDKPTDAIIERLLK